MHKPNNLLEFDVKDDLDWDPALDAARIVVKADDGRVTLSGVVPTYYETIRASEDAWSVGGVRELDNELLVGPAGDAITDAEIEAECTAALDRDTFVPDDSVSASVSHGRVTLRGHVRHHFQRQAAKTAVYNVKGVLGVNDMISISSDPIPGDVADRINRAFKRNAIIDESRITVSNEGPTVYLDGTVSSYAARREAVDTAWNAPGVSDVVDRLVMVP